MLFQGFNDDRLPQPCLKEQNVQNSMTYFQAKNNSTTWQVLNDV